MLRQLIEGEKKVIYLYVLRNTDAIAVLVELSFIDNMDDLHLLKENIDTFARAIACGVTDFGVF